MFFDATSSLSSKQRVEIRCRSTGNSVQGNFFRPLDHSTICQLVCFWLQVSFKVTPFKGVTLHCRIKEDRRVKMCVIFLKSLFQSGTKAVKIAYLF